MDNNGPAGRVTSSTGSARRVAGSPGLVKNTDDEARDRASDQTHDGVNRLATLQSLDKRAAGLVVLELDGQKAKHGTEPGDEERDHSARVTASTGDVNGDGEIVGALYGGLHINGTMLAPLPWNERPGFHGRIEGAGQDPDAIRRMIRCGGAS